MKQPFIYCLSHLIKARAHRQRYLYLSLHSYLRRSPPIPLPSLNTRQSFVTGRGALSFHFLGDKIIILLILGILILLVKVSHNEDFNAWPF